MPDSVIHASSSQPPIPLDRYYNRRGYWNPYWLGLFLAFFISVYHLGAGPLLALPLMTVLPFVLCLAPFVLVTAIHFFERWYQRRRERLFVSKLMNLPNDNPIRRAILHTLRSDSFLSRRSTNPNDHYFSVSDATRLYAIMLELQTDLSLLNVPSWVDQFVRYRLALDMKLRWIKPTIECLFMISSVVLGSHFMDVGLVLFGGVINGMMVGVCIGVLLAYAVTHMVEAIYNHYLAKEMLASPPTPTNRGGPSRGEPANGLFERPPLYSELPQPLLSPPPFEDEAEHLEENNPPGYTPMLTSG